MFLVDLGHGVGHKDAIEDTHSNDSQNHFAKWEE